MQTEQIAIPIFADIARVVVERLKGLPQNEGVDKLEPLLGSVSEEEGRATGVQLGIEIPDTIRKKTKRCLCDNVESLLKSGVITSGETLAIVLPRITSEIRSIGVERPELRVLYASIYRAFRRRRSLLLLNLEKQIQIDELPWIKAVERFRRDDLSSVELSKQTLQEVVSLAVVSFPHVILPNKLLQELRALIRGAKLDMPLVDEVAADIFMGAFSDKFLEAEQRAGALLSDTLYSAYYDIDYEMVARMKKSTASKRRRWFRTQDEGNAFAEFCAKRAGVSLGGWDVAENGMTIEQQQILTTQNLAVVFQGLGLTESLKGELSDLAKGCFRWICKRQQVNADRGHAKLVMLKNTAYAWRQMIFFLSLADRREQAAFVEWAKTHLGEQAWSYRERFKPALKGLEDALSGKSMNESGSGRRFLGWTNRAHWLLESP